MKILLPQRPGLVFDATLRSRPSPVARDELQTVLEVSGHPPMQLEPPSAGGAVVVECDDAEWSALVAAGYSLERRASHEHGLGMRMIAPVGRSWWAIAAGYLGLFSLVIVPAPVTVIVSAIAMWHLRKNPKLHGWGRAVFGMVMGLLFSAILVVILLGDTRPF